MKGRVPRKARKMRLEKASASEIISALGIGRAEERRARAAVETAERLIRRTSGVEKKCVSGKVARLPKTNAV